MERRRLVRPNAGPTILQASHDPALFRPFFRTLDSWFQWFVVLKAMFGLALNDAELAVLQKLTGCSTRPSEPVKEAWFICGRRAGKSFVVALIAVYLACFRDYSAYLAPGERGTVMIVAADRKQARVILRYVKAFLEIPMLRRLVERETLESVDLTNRITIEVHTPNFRLIRGYTIVCFIGDEMGVWRADESAFPDREVITAVRPAMLTIPNALLLGIGSPYAQRGVLFEAYRDHYGHGHDGVLVIQADTRTMNPIVDEKIIADAYAKDPVAASAEYGAQFRTDLADLFDGAWIENAVMRDRHELPPLPQHQYVAFTDPSGGARDSFTLGIAHAEEGAFVLDVLRSRRPPFDPSSVVDEYASLLKTYRLHQVTGDRYAAQWVVEAFGKAGIAYQHSERTKSQIYLEALPLFATGTVRLLDRRTLLTELHQLERRTSRSGKDSVDHPVGGHDDEANAACGALVRAAIGIGRIPTDAQFVVGGRLAAAAKQERFVSMFDQIEARSRRPSWMNDLDDSQPLDWDY